jgi:type IV pilus assembly protein PilC
MPHQFRQKESGYQALADLLRSGAAFPAALEKTARSGWLRPKVQALRTSLSQGKTIGEMASQFPSVFSELEAGTLAAGERCGKLDQACDGLALYFGALHRSREELKRRLVYPLFLLHFGVSSLSLPVLLQKGVSAFAGEVLPPLTLLYGCILATFILWKVLWTAAAHSYLADRFLWCLPMVGNLRRQFAAARFCSVYGFCLEAGVNVLEALQFAGMASQSGAFLAAARTAIAAVRTGSNVGSALLDCHILTEELALLWSVGEETGQLDRNLKNWSEKTFSQCLTDLAQTVSFFTKCASFLVTLYLGWRILSSYQSHFTEIEQILGI